MGSAVHASRLLVQVLGLFSLLSVIILIGGSQLVSTPKLN